MAAPALLHGHRRAGTVPRSGSALWHRRARRSCPGGRQRPELHEEGVGVPILGVAADLAVGQFEDGVAPEREALTGGGRRLVTPLTPVYSRWSHSHILTRCRASNTRSGLALRSSEIPQRGDLGRILLPLLGWSASSSLPIRRWRLLRLAGVSRRPSRHWRNSWRILEASRGRRSGQRPITWGWLSSRRARSCWESSVPVPHRFARRRGCPRHAAAPGSRRRPETGRGQSGRRPRR
jgi:hypothetical protein